MILIKLIKIFYLLYNKQKKKMKSNLKIELETKYNLELENKMDGC